MAPGGMPERPEPRTAMALPPASRAPLSASSGAPRESRESTGTPARPAARPM